MDSPRICVTVTGRTVEAIRQAAGQAREADLIEVRLDSMDRPDPGAVLNGLPRPAIATCRPTWEGGTFAGSEEERARILEAALTANAAFVDVEAAAPFAAALIAPRRGRGVIVSAHVFDGVPADLLQRYRYLRSRGAEVIKLAVAARNLCDMLPLFSLADELRDDPHHVLVAMGNAGVATRILAARLRNLWTYAGSGVAPGQLPAARLVREYGFRTIRRDVELYAVVGSPVLHSRSPVMHNAGFRESGRNAAYVPLETDDAGDFVRFARAMRLRGASITAPLKIALATEMDDLDAVAVRVGAVNTLVVRNDRWVGCNTDVEGLLVPLRQRLPLRNARATVLGAGGAASAAAVALAGEGSRVTISARNGQAAARVAALAGGTAGPFPPAEGTWDLLVNTIPVSPDAPNPMAGARLDGRVVFDLTYAPLRTPLLAAAEAAGCTTISGLEMLMAQAERQFELWTGRRPPDGLFRTQALADGLQAELPGATTTPV